MKSNLLNNTKIAVFIRSSAGELEWVLPIIHKLILEGALVDIFYLSLEGQKNCLINSTCIKAINDLGIKNKLILGKNIISIHYYLDLLYRASNKIGYKFIKIFIKEFLTTFFLKILKFHNGKFDYKYIFFEIRDKSLFYNCLQRLDTKRNFYFPHSPHIYNISRSLGKDSKENINFSEDIKEVYLFGDKPSKEILVNKKLFTISSKKALIIGHPRFSQYWINYLKKIYKSNISRNGFTVAILSRGIGNYIDKKEHIYLCETVSEELIKNTKVTKVLVKYHPREKLDSYWESFSHPKFFRTLNSVSEIMLEADLIIGFWTSAALDANLLGVPFIEFYRPDINRIGQMKIGDDFKTIYEILESVYSAKEFSILRKLLDQSIKGELLPKKGSSQINDLFELSNNWWDYLKEAL